MKSLKRKSKKFTKKLDSSYKIQQENSWEKLFFFLEINWNRRGNVYIIEYYLFCMEFEKCLRLNHFFGLMDYSSFYSEC